MAQDFRGATQSQLAEHLGLGVGNGQGPEILGATGHLVDHGSGFGSLTATEKLRVGSGRQQANQACGGQQAKTSM